MKLIFQLIGFLVVIVVLLTAVLFYLDSKDLLSGDLAVVTRTVHTLFTQTKTVLLSFLQNSGIADDAADLLDQGADMLRGGQQPTEAPTIIEMLTPAP